MSTSTSTVPCFSFWTVPTIKQQMEEAKKGKDDDEGKKRKDEDHHPTEEGEPADDGGKKMKRKKSATEEGKEVIGMDNSGSSGGTDHREGTSNTDDQQQKAKKQQPVNMEEPTATPALRIHRLFRNEDGIEVRQEETINDPRLIKQYLKMRTLCSREQLWHYAFDAPDAEQDFRAMRRKLQKRFDYYAKKAKEQKKNMNKKQQNGTKAEETKMEEALSSSVNSAPLKLNWSNSPPSANELSRQQPTNSSESITSSSDSTEAGAVRQQCSRGDTARRPNAGVKRRRYSPGAEARNPQHQTRDERWNR